MVLRSIPYVLVVVPLMAFLALAFSPLTALGALVLCSLAYAVWVALRRLLGYVA